MKTYKIQTSHLISSINDVVNIMATLMPPSCLTNSKLRFCLLFQVTTKKFKFQLVAASSTSKPLKTRCPTILNKWEMMVAQQDSEFCKVNCLHSYVENNLWQKMAHSTQMKKKISMMIYNS